MTDEPEKIVHVDLGKIAAPAPTPITERAFALSLSNKLLEEPNADPDDALHTLARNLCHASSKERWLNVLNSLESIDRHELEAAGLVWPNERWARFCARPADAFRLLDDTQRAAVWSIVEQRLDGR